MKKGSGEGGFTSQAEKERGRRRLEKLLVERQRLSGMLRFERALWRRGYHHVAGVDEVGVGPLAGPVVAAAIVLPRGVPDAGLAAWAGLNDSKKVSPQRRKWLESQLKERAIAWALGCVGPEEIDSMGIGPAGLCAMRRAVRGLNISPDFVLVDARTLDVPVEQQAIVRGDQLSQSIAAASIVAKEARDRIMARCAEHYPGYGFERHMGYGTREHLGALGRLGPTQAHRKSFAPVALHLKSAAKSAP